MISREMLADVKNTDLLPLALVALLLLSACAPHTLYRSSYERCVSAQPETDCSTNALQEYRPANPEEPGYLLGFIELDDQGELFDRAQMTAVVNAVFEEAAPEDKDLLMVVFVHGWKHSAAPGDDNIETFRAALRHLSTAEARIARAAGTAPRQVVGIYLGWRGGSVTVPVVQELTFWDRKNTAYKVGHGGVTEALSRLELVRQTKDALAPSGRSATRLVVVGHSFGGAVVFAALSQILENRFIHTAGPAGTVSDAEGFGSLVVLINPAFEAVRFAPLSDMSTERGSYFTSQLPVLAILTSEADDATRVAFPAGRLVSTLFEKTREVERTNGLTGQKEVIDQHQANITAVGHFGPYKTHDLRAVVDDESGGREGLAADRPERTFFLTSQRWENDAPGSEIPFKGSLLKRTTTSAGRNPYLVIRVDKELIHDHNHIDDPRVIQFVNQLILISGQSEDPKLRARERARGLAQ
jgi:pimeloyl-ACP methyl ester carboxylesterase